MTTSTTRPYRALTRANGMLVAAVTAGAILAAGTGAHAAQLAPEPPASTGFTSEEQEQAAAIAKGIAELGVTEEQFAAAINVSLTRPAPNAEDVQKRLANLPAKPSAEQIVRTAYPEDTEAQAALRPLLTNEEVRNAALAQLDTGAGVGAVDATGKQNGIALRGWWDTTKFAVKCGAAVAAVFISFVPAGSSIKVARAVALFKRYGAKKTANIIWRFVNGKHVGSKEREAVKAFIGISAISSACSK
ncbi:hypothetical protein [Streptomyces sp. NPDC051218]|uniref:hypothetical protein n=1 Tax=Streptomyces sp. NPDC051218 TaxID=3365645 RepID=UPI0037A7C72C